MKRIIDKIKELNWSTRINYLFYFVMSLVFIFNGVFNYFMNQATIENLLSYILFAIGLVCFEDFLGRFLFFQDIQKDLNDLKEKDNKRFTNSVCLTTRKDIENRLSLSERLSDATEVKMFSYANSSLFQPIFITEIEEGIKRGTCFKFVGFDPNSDIIQKIIKYKMLNHTNSNPMKVTCHNYYKFKSDNSYTDEQILYKICDIDFPYGMTIVHKRNGEITVKVDMYSINTPNLNRRCMFLSSLNSSEKELIEFFLKQWDEVWNLAKEYEYSD